VVADRDLYAILGVPRSASSADIRKAFKKIAVANHPDRNPGNKAAEERFKEANYASEILLDEKKRPLYDEFGEIGVKEGFNADAYRAYSAGRGAPGGFGGFGGEGGFDLEDLLRQAAQRGGPGRGPGGFGGFQDAVGGDVFESLFGRAGRQTAQAPQDFTTELTVSFVEALRGCEKQLQFTGADMKTVKVRIPAGVANGGKLRLRGQGPRGADLVLVVHVKPHPQFSRDGLDLLVDLPVTVVEAARGAKVEVPTLEGPVTLVIPPGVSAGARLRLKGKGVKRGKQQGDLIARLNLVLPPPDARGLDKALEAFEKAYGDLDPRRDLKL
jgi:DnaJ-class molecular chaperone